MCDSGGGAGGGGGGGGGGVRKVLGGNGGLKVFVCPNYKIWWLLFAKCHLRALFLPNFTGVKLNQLPARMPGLIAMDRPTHVMSYVRHFRTQYCAHVTIHNGIVP